MQRVIRVVYEDGVLKPLQPVRLGNRKICFVSVYPEEEWQKDLDLLLRNVRRHTRRFSPATIEADITKARAEVKAKRHEARRPA